MASSLTPRRLRAHAIILAVCLWGVCAIDFATPGIFDRSANIKFQDFLSFYISGKLIAQGRAADLYDESVRHEELLAIVRSPEGFHENSPRPTAAPTPYLPNLYGPQVASLFVPFTRLPFLTAAGTWVVLCLLIYFGCLFLVLKSGVPRLAASAGSVDFRLNFHQHSALLGLAAVAFPPLFHFFVRGQISVLVLACFTAAFVALQADQLWLAGLALGFLIFKPQFLVAIPLILLLAQSWKILGGLLISASAQLALTRLYFGPAVMRSYLDVLLHTSRWIDLAELPLAPVQMHSLRSFWTLLIPASPIALALYVFSSIFVIALTAAIWKSQLSVALKFSALTFAAVLANPHLFVYDLLVLAPALLLLANWTLDNEQHSFTPPLRLLLYLAFLLPLFGPTSQWTHLQLSVPVFVAILWTLHHFRNRDDMRAEPRPIATPQQSDP